MTAHTYNELEEMLKSFRCQDLANLLAYAGQSKNGKKSELYDRCLNILKKGNTNIQIKIKEIYNAKLSTSTINSYSSLISAINSNSNSGSSSPDPSMLNRYQTPNSTASSVPPSIYSNTFNQFPNNNQMSSHNGTYPHSIVTRSSNVFNGSNSTNFSNQTTKVQFEKLAFFQFLHELYPAAKITSVNPNQRPYSYWFNFFLTVDQANEITGTREMISNKLEYSKQIHLRFGYFESTIQVDNLPANLTVNVNGRPAVLPAPKPTSKPNADIIRPGRSIDVTALCRLAPNIPNKVEINWTNPDPSKQYCVGVYVFKKVSVQTLIQNLKQNCIRDAEVTRQMVREKLQITDSDFEIETSTLKVSLQCPLMKTRMQLPGRSYKCKHVQCFELESYLMMNEKKPTWSCPVCDQNAPYDDLIIDGLNQEILAKCGDIEEVQFAADGTWSKVTELEKAAPIKKKEDKKPVEEVSFVEICESPPPVKRNNSCDSAPPVVTQQNNNNNNKDDDIIDLTCESDEEMPLQEVYNKLSKERSTSRSSSNSSIYNNQQNSTEVQVSSDSNQFNEDLNKINKNLTNNNINNKEMRSPETRTNPTTSQSLNPTTSPSQSIISLSSNSSILEDQSRSQTPTNLDQLNTNANHIITNISKLFQNDMLQPLQRPPNASSNSSTISMETTPTINPIMSNSQLARGLSAPSPTRHESMTVSPNHLMKQSSSSSLTSIPSIMDNVNSRAAISPVSANKFASNSKSGPQSPMQPKKLALEQRVNPSVKQLPMQQRPNEHSLVNSSNVNKFKRTEYVTKEKALMVSEEIKSMQSNPNTNMTILEQNYKARNMPVPLQTAKRPNIVQNFNQNINKMQPQTNRSSFENEQMNQVIKNTQQQQQQHMLNKQPIPHLNKQMNNNLAINKPIQPQRPFDPSRPTSSNDPSHLKQRNSLQDQRTFAPNIPLNQKATNLNQSKQIPPQLQQQHQQQQKQPVSNQFYNQKHVTSPPGSMSPSGLVSKQGQTSRVNPIQASQLNSHQQQQQFNQLNYAKQSNGSAPQSSQHSQLNRVNPFNGTQPGHYYPPQPQHLQMQQQVRHQQQQQHAHQH